MPLYEYYCEDCGEEFEKIVRFSEADLTQTCPNCGAARTYKKISAVASYGGNAAGSGASYASSSCGSGGFS
jgi:putative FmdB family regulatory protein